METRERHERMTTEELQEELEQFTREREHIKNMLGRIGGAMDIRRHKVFNWIILGVTLVLFMLEITTRVLPTLISLEVGLVLISVKIILLIQSMLKQNHFEFWMLNTIEYRINDLGKRMDSLERSVRRKSVD